MKNRAGRPEKTGVMEKVGRRSLWWMRMMLLHRAKKGTEKERDGDQGEEFTGLSSCKIGARMILWSILYSLNTMLPPHMRSFVFIFPAHQVVFLPCALISCYPCPPPFCLPSLLPQHSSRARFLFPTCTDDHLILLLSLTSLR